MPTPYLIVAGDCRALLPRMAPECINCIVTSPPYWGLRDYGVAGQIGLEAKLDDYVTQLTAIFRVARRALRPDGTLWLNLGDSYAGSWGAQSREHAGKHAPNVSALSANQVKAAQIRSNNTGSLSRTPNLKAKDLCGIPWRVAFALQADGWYLRQDIIWHKPNPMPESVTDRCTKAHEYLFLLSKSERYFYDAEAVKEDAATDRALTTWDARKAIEPMRRGDPAQSGHITTTGTLASRPGRNRRSVWKIATSPFREAHFATFPPALIEPAILAGCPPNGVVLDPFGGAGTTALVATRLGRRSITMELNPDYVEMAERRLAR